MKILVVEDERTFSLILRRTLEKLGHEVVVAANGSEACEHIQRESFPLVISDWMMPVMDGPSLCRRIRADARVQGAYTYVILLTARNDRQDRVEGLYSGADDFLEKPLGKGELFARIEIARRILEVQEDLLRKNEQLTTLNTELDQFASIACHDLQEPLRKIQIFSSRLSDQYLEQLGIKGAELVDRIQNSSARMHSLLKDLFLLTEVDRTEQPFVEVDLRQVVDDVLSDLEAVMAESGGSVRVDGQLPTLNGDPLQIHQLFQNLIGNGLKYHVAGKAPVVSVSAADAPQVRIEIADNGIGFEEKYFSKIMEPFQRLHGRDEYEGTGIGLAICKKIVDRHGGTISAHSAVGQGARFTVDFPSYSTEKRYV